MLNKGCYAMTHTIKNVIIDALESVAIAVALYFLLSSITYGLLLAMPSIGSLSTVATYFATIGVIGLSCALAIFAIGLIIGPFIIAKLYHEEHIDLLSSTLSVLLFLTVASLVGAAILSVGLSIPFFLSILGGSPVFVTSSFLSFLSLSSVTAAYIAGGGLLIGSITSHSVLTYLNKGNNDDYYKTVGHHRGANSNEFDTSDLNVLRKFDDGYGTKIKRVSIPGNSL